MALKLKLKKAEFEKLDEVTKKLYVAGEGDEFILDTEGGEDTGALRRAKDREKGRADSLQTKLDELQSQLDEVSTNTAKKNGDIKTLEAQWQKKLDDQKTLLEGTVGKQNSFITKKLIESESTRIAAKISTVPALMTKALRERMTVDLTGDEPRLVIMGTDGKPSDLTADKLGEEFVANPEFKSIIIGSKASGGAGGGDKGKPSGGAANQSSQSEKDVPLAKWNPKDLAARLKANKEASNT